MLFFSYNRLVWHINFYNYELIINKINAAFQNCTFPSEDKSLHFLALYQYVKK